MGDPCNYWPLIKKGETDGGSPERGEGPTKKGFPFRERKKGPRVLVPGRKKNEGLLTEC